MFLTSLQLCQFLSGHDSFILGAFDQSRDDSMYVIYGNIILYKSPAIIRVFLVHCMPLYPIIHTKLIRNYQLYNFILV